MSLVAMGSGGVQRPGMELEPRHVGAELSLVEGTARDLVTAGLDLGVLDQGLVEFAAGALGSEGREPALILPLYDKFNRHIVFAHAQDSASRPETLYVARRGQSGYGSAKVTEAHWQEGTRLSPGGYKLQGSTEMVGAESSLVVATTAEGVQTIVQWKNKQAEALQQLEQEGPLRKATALVEAAFGGIDITEPERSVKEFSTRLLLAALLERQHKSDNYVPSFIDEDIIDSRLRRLFASVNGPHVSAYHELLAKTTAAAELIVVEDTIEADRVKFLAEMLSHDTARFLQGIWPDLERMIALERLDRHEMGRILKQLNSPY